MGYQGYSPGGIKNQYQPRKKIKNKPRTQEDKEYNKKVSQIRVHVEHAIGGIKRSNIIHDIYRGRKQNHENQVIQIASGLHNYRMEERMHV